LNKQRKTQLISNFIREIVIVIIGIFIAFQLNNYSENRKTKNKEIKSLKRLMSDLETEKKILEHYKNNFNRKSKKLEDIIYNENNKNLDSLYLYVAEEYIHYNFNTEYSSLKFSGNLDIISNDSLRYNLVKYYELGYSYYKEISKNHKNFVENDLIEYLNKNVKIDSSYLYNPLIIKEKLKDEEFKQYIKSQIMYYKLNTRTYKIDMLEKLINDISNNIKTNANTV
tara:strand:+ start:35 stop:712 length:678 start_codon:yes stop_codon:yes gene_type:complete